MTMNNDYFVDVVFTAPGDEESNDFGATPLDNLPPVMAYTPMQKWQRLYDPDVGLDRGTIFSELDLPFLGRPAIEK